MISTLSSSIQAWTLTEISHDGQSRTIELPRRNLLVGRSEDADIHITSGGVSKRHAKIAFRDGFMIVEDLGSTNGTHLNGRPLRTSTVVEGDLLQFANALFRVGHLRAPLYDGTREEGILPWVGTLLMFDRLMSERAVVPHFQSIVTLDMRQRVAFELLARSELDGLQNPALMFGAAERLGQQAALSELMRAEGMRVADQSENRASEFFLNTHPCEIMNDRLIASLRELRASHPTLRITIEVHEAAMTDLKMIREFRCVLDSLEMRLSFDDFGAGQGRLVELTEVSPDVLKFDMQLIRGIDSAGPRRQELLAALVRMAIGLGTVPLAEGIETEGEHEVCRQLGFQLGQGYLYGRPSPMLSLPAVGVSD